jgi:hypothetical protein
MVRNYLAHDNDDRNITRRSLLRGTGGALAAGSLPSLLSQASAAKRPGGGGGGGDGPYYNTVQSSAVDKDWDHKVLLTTTIKYSDPYYHDSFNGVGVDVQVDSEAAAFYLGNPERLRDTIGWNKIKIKYPEDEVFAGESENWIGGMANYDDPEDADVQEKATAVIDEALGYTPYIGSVLNAVGTAKRLDRLTTPSEAPDKKEWQWEFSNAKRVNTWVRFVAEASEGENYELDIHNAVGGLDGTNTDFTLYL